MRRVVAVVSAVVGVIAAALVASSLAAGMQSPDAHSGGSGRTAALPGSVVIVRTGSGGTTACNPHIVCSESGYAPVTFTMPANVRSYRATLTVSFRYRATRSATAYVVHPAVLGPHRTVVAAYPAGARPVLSTGGRQQSMTIVLRLGELRGGRTYALKNNPDFAGGLHLDSKGELPSGSITVSQVVYQVQAWAA